MMALLRTLAALVTLAPLLAGQDAKPAKGSMAGTVVDSVSGRPLAKVLVTAYLPGQSRAELVTTSDAKGNFKLVDLEAGTYRLCGERNDYLLSFYGARRAEEKGTLITLQPGQELKDLELKLVPFGVMAGVVRDADGEPLTRIRVTAYKAEYGVSGRVLRGTSDIETDDLGQYRLAGLVPGKYYLAADEVPVDYSSKPPPEDRSAEGSLLRRVLTAGYYPTALDPSEARPIDVAPGARVAGLDITLIRRPVVRLTVHVTAPAKSQPTAALRSGRDEFWPMGKWFRGDRNKDGDFEFANLPAGSYELSVQGYLTPPVDVGGVSFSSGGSSPRTSMRVEVGERDLEVRIAVTRRAVVTGHVRWVGEDGSLASSEAVIKSTHGWDNSIWFARPGKDSSVTQIGDNHAFRVELTAGKYEVRYARPDDEKKLFVQSIRSGNIDVMREGLVINGPGEVAIEIVVMPGAGSLTGMAVDKEDKPSAGSTVVVIPEVALRRRSDRFFTASTDQFGHYLIEGIPPGEYKVLAWEDVERGSWFDPDFLKQFEPHAEAVKIEVKTTANVKVHAQ